MAYLNDDAVTLRRYDYSETSQVLVLFGRARGKLRLIAKGIKRGTRRRFATGVDLLELGQVVYTRREGRAARLGTLVEWNQETVFPKLRTAAGRLFAAQYLAEISALLTAEEDPHPGLFDGLVAALRELETTDALAAAVVRFQCALLTAAGLMPDLTRCMECSRQFSPRPGWSFSSQLGGLVCRNCEAPIVEKRRVSQRAIQALLDSWNREPQAAPGSPADDPLRDPALAAGAFDVLDYHIAHMMGRPNRLADYVVPAAQRRTLR